MKVKIKKEEKKAFAEEVEVREIKVKDLIAAQAVSGQEKGFKFMLACFAEIALFDGQKKTMEDLYEMNANDFFSMEEGLAEAGLHELSEQLSSAREKENSGPTT